MDQNARGLVEVHFQRCGRSDPAIVVCFLIELYGLIVAAYARVIEKNEMGLAIKFFGINTVLDEDEADLRDLKICLLFDLAPKRVGGTLAVFDLAPGNSPKIRPFMSADHEHLAVAI